MSHPYSKGRDSSVRVHKRATKTVKATNAPLSPADIRARAATLVSEVLDQGRSLDALFSHLEGSAQERGLTRVLVYGTIRWGLRLEAALGKLSSRPTAELDANLRALLLVGLFQLMHTDIAIHAAVAETVEAARKLKQAKAAGFVNAILRRCEREKSSLEAALDRDPATRTAHPKWLVDRLKNDWPDRYGTILDANNELPPMWLRVSAKRTTTIEYLEQLRGVGIAAEAGQHSPHAIRLHTATDVYKLPRFDEGFCSVQDAAAQWAAYLLGAKPGDRVLDACAAPGGKTCHVLELESAISELVAIDLSPNRLRRVQENLERLDLQATIVAGDALKPEDWWNGNAFQRILLDVPCSATGVIRRHPDIKILRRESDIQELAAQQAHLLRTAWTLLAPGGRLLYASCSALRAENADIVAAFLQEHPDASDVTMKVMQERLSATSDLPTYAGPGYAIAAGQSNMDGFYYACLDKAPR